LLVASCQGECQWSVVRCQLSVEELIPGLGLVGQQQVTLPLSPDWCPSLAPVTTSVNAMAKDSIGQPKSDVIIWE